MICVVARTQLMCISVGSMMALSMCIIIAVQALLGCREVSYQITYGHVTED